MPRKMFESKQKIKSRRKGCCLREAGALSALSAQKWALSVLRASHCIQLKSILEQMTSDSTTQDEANTALRLTQRVKL